MRPRLDAQLEIDFPISNLNVTNEFYAKYRSISTILDENPEILDLVHRQVKHVLEADPKTGSGPERFRYTRENVLRILIVQSLEGLSLRETVVRIDDSKVSGRRTHARRAAHSKRRRACAVWSRPQVFERSGARGVASSRAMRQGRRASTSGGEFASGSRSKSASR